MKDSLRQHFEADLQLSSSAVSWLIDLWDVVQGFDDLTDSDPVDLNPLLWKALIGLPANLFFSANAATLLPVMANALLKWKASDTVERAGNADAKSYVWRASYYDVVLMVYLLCHGSDAAMKNADKVLSLYGETYDGYVKEFA